MMRAGCTRSTGRSPWHSSNRAHPDRRVASTVLCYHHVSRFSRLDPDEAAFHEDSLRRAGVAVINTHETGANETGG